MENLFQRFKTVKEDLEWKLVQLQDGNKKDYEVFEDIENDISGLYSYVVGYIESKEDLNE